MTMEWQPIETAPDDGTPFLVTDGELTAVGWLGEHCGSIDLLWGCLKFKSTHWMPLPEPPTVSACKEDRQSRRTQHELPPRCSSCSMPAGRHIEGCPMLILIPPRYGATNA